MKWLRELLWTAFTVLLMAAMVATPFIILALSVNKIDVKYGYAEPASVDNMLNASVRVQSGKDSGSGVAFRNGKHVFVWTAAHVVAGSLERKLVADKLGNVNIVTSFPDVLLFQDVVENGRKGGFQVAYAEVIRYSARQDLCLLKVRINWPMGSVVFAGDGDAAVGSPVFHVGSMSGVRGANSLTEGIVSALGRLRIDGRPEEVFSSDVYDQLAITAHPGSSGGGVFLKSDGTPCVGLVIEFLGPGHLPGVLCMAPVRRMREFAVEANCRWAMSTDITVPDRDDEPVVQDAVPVEPVP